MEDVVPEGGNNGGHEEEEEEEEEWDGMYAWIGTWRGEGGKELGELIGGRQGVLRLYAPVRICWKKDMIVPHIRGLSKINIFTNKAKWILFWQNILSTKYKPLLYMYNAYCLSSIVLR